MRKTLVLAMTVYVGSLLSSPMALGADLYQWRDANGSTHYTDNIQSVPQSIRDGAGLIVRKNYFISEPGRPKPREFDRAPINRSTPNESRENNLPTAIDAKPEVETQIIDGSRDTTVVIVNPISSLGQKNPVCLKPNCQPRYRANFNDRQYIHPSVFSGGERRRHIHP